MKPLSTILTMQYCAKLAPHKRKPTYLGLGVNGAYNRRRHKHTKLIFTYRFDTNVSNLAILANTTPRNQVCSIQLKEHIFVI
jgi:hypothetical protein